MSKDLMKVIIESTEEGYVAHCPALKGCMSQGETLEEVKQNVKEAIIGWLEAKIALETKNILSEIIKKNQASKVPRDGKRIENIRIPPQSILAGA